MPRILRIMNRIAIGGPLLNAAYLTKYLAPDFETLLIAGGKEDHEQDAGFITDRLDIHPLHIPEMERSINFLKDYKAFRKVKSIIRDFKPDIVHTHAAKPGMIGRSAASSMKVPVIVHTYHGHVFHSYFGKLKTKAIIETERNLARRSDAIIAISEQQKRELTEDFKIASPEKFRVIPLGLDLDKFQEDYSCKRTKFRKEFGLKENEIAITIIGRLVPVKNHPLFLEAFHKILKTSGKKVKAFIVGDGESRTQLENYATNLGIKFTVETDTNHEHPLVFTSWRTDIDVINAGSDIIALTSLNEGTPVSLIEAQAANNPIVSTNVGGIQDIILENETALLSESNHIEKFYENLYRLIEDDDLRNRLGNKGADFVMQRFSYRRLVSDMKTLYFDLLEKKKHVI
ncbi:MAG: glycosyltransferase [Bacteroidetes bacterium]|nr:glycosyltransferase [Bacteroidota bacterium]MBS1633526.1 glycosyltransferase [Bacteroidota bacterium]